MLIHEFHVFELWTGMNVYDSTIAEIRVRIPVQTFLLSKY